MAADSSNYDNELYPKVCDDLEDRSNYESRLILWARMRNQGVRRQRKPWPGASDAHVPVADTIIGKLKAYYVQWIFGPELLASFFALEEQGDSYTDSVAQWFDYQVRERSNFTSMAICAIDSLLQNGVGFLKTYWDSDKERLAFTSVHPYFVIVPPYTQDIADADRVVHVMHMSEDEYRRSAEKRGYKTDDDYVDSIKGEGKPDSKYAESRYVAEGLSYSRLKDLIILWECYVKKEDGSVEVQTFSPLQPDEPARNPFKLPYRHGKIPLVQLPYELIDPGFFSSRGVTELVQMFEASATKMWNEKVDFMSIANRPVLSTQGGSINAQNIRWEPGAVYDSTLQLVQQPPPPVDFDQEIQSNRSFAEQRVGIPDFGVGAQEGSQGKNKTATETNVITTVMQQSNDLRARVTKEAVSKIYEQAWSILRQYKKDDLDYFWRKKRITLDDAAFDNAYVLRPNGSVDGYSREKEIQKLMQLRQLAVQPPAPWIKIPEIDRKIIELMDSDWISALYEQPEDVAADEQENQAHENSVMMDGFLPRVKPNDDHAAHLGILLGFIQWSQNPANGVKIGPTVLPTFLQHATNHLQAAHQDAQYMQAHGADIAKAAGQISAIQKGLQQQQAAQQQAGLAMANLRGGSLSGTSAGVPNGVPAGTMPVAPPTLPPPGMPAGAGPVMPPGGMPPNPANGSTPAL